MFQKIKARLKGCYLQFLNFLHSQLSQKTKNRLTGPYLKFLNFLHSPFVKRGVKDPYHAVFDEFFALGESLPSPSMLELGSRNRSGVLRRGMFPFCEDYIGFDVLEGEGVDVVGDAHNLSKYFPRDRFDLCYSVSVFEHLMFPWKIALEMNRVLKTGGYVLVLTHPVWPAHELPWDFWRFPENSFRALFNKPTGFEIVSITEGLPGKIYSLVEDPATQLFYTYPLNIGAAVIARKTGDYREDLLKWDIDVSDVVGTMYPKH